MSVRSRTVVSDVLMSLYTQTQSNATNIVTMSVTTNTKVSDSISNYYRLSLWVVTITLVNVGIVERSLPLCVD